MTGQAMRDSVREQLYNAVAYNAKRWWEMKRPVGWTLAQHLDQPTVNCSTGTEMDLAHAVAGWLR